MTKEELEEIKKLRELSKKKMGDKRKMTKDEMKNRISMALKDPILQQGFEIICKENAEFKETVIKMNNVITETFSNLTKAKDLILNLYNAGRDVLMCRNEELAYTRLDDAINDKRIEQFLKEVEKNG